MPILMWLFAVPFLASLTLFLLSFISDKYIKRLSIVLSLIPLIILLINHTHWVGSFVKYEWIPSLSIQFHLKMDTLSLLFVYITALIVPISLFAAETKTLVFPRQFYGLILLMQGLLIGFFTARDLALFTVLWEGMLIPLYLIINGWGGQFRQQAALKFILYMFAGSILIVAAVLSVYFASGTFDMDVLEKISGTLQSAPYAAFICGVFFLAFAVKTPLFPFHAWLPDAYYQAPVTGSILLASILSKAGIYGFLRIGMEMFPTFMKEWSPLLMALAIAGVLYAGVAAFRQQDYKRLIAYSSLSHVNFILAGVFAWNPIASLGALLQVLNHSITITGLFLAAGWLEKRIHTTAIREYGGLAKYMPRLCWLTLIFVLASIALPGTNNFVGEFLILYGMFGQNPWAASILALTVILSVLYMLRWMQKTYFGPARSFPGSWVDIGHKAILIALPLLMIIFWIGIYPKPVLNQLKKAVEQHNIEGKQNL